VPKEYVSLLLCLEGFLGSSQLSFHFSVFVASQGEYVSKTPLSRVIMITFYFTSKPGYKYIALCLFIVQLTFMERVSEFFENRPLFGACAFPASWVLWAVRFNCFWPVVKTVLT